MDYLCIVIFFQLFGLSFWRHPFTAEDPLVSKWCNAKFLQICFDEETNSSTSWMTWVNFHYWVNYTFKKRVIMLILNRSVNYVVMGGEVTSRIFPLPTVARVWQSPSLPAVSEQHHVLCALRQALGRNSKDKAEERHPINNLARFWSLISLFRERGGKNHE